MPTASISKLSFKIWDYVVGKSITFVYSSGVCEPILVKSKRISLLSVVENVFHDILVDRSIVRSMVFFFNHPQITMCIVCMCIFICPEEVEWQQPTCRQ